MVREAFFGRAHITVRPSKKGLKEIDESHDCYRLKYLTNKPISTLKGDEWMKLMEAEKAKQLEITFAKEFMNNFLHDAQKLYIFDAYSAMVKQWNTLTKDCVEFAFTKILYPMMTKELRNKLTREAKDGVISACRSTLYDWLKIGKYTADDFEEEDEDEWGTKDGCRIMAVMYENDLDVAAYAVIINTEGKNCTSLIMASANAVLLIELLNNDVENMHQVLTRKLAI